MRCSNCAVEVPVLQGPCPNCGVDISLASRESFGKRHPAVLISLTLAAFLAVDGSIGFAAYTVLKPGFLGTAHRGKQTFAPRRTTPHTEFPVEHGNTIRPEELHGHGTLYFVPVGAQAIPVQSLADYYKEKFGVDVTVLPAVAGQPSDCVPQRRQCVAEELIGEMTGAYSEIARNPESVMIALTDEDIYPRELGWRFTYSLHGTRIGIVSTRRMDPAFRGQPHDEAIRLAATRQMLTKYVALLYYHVPESWDPTSIMYSPLNPDGGPDDLHESDLHSEASANGRRGKPYPCIFFTYSYQTHEVSPADPALTDCWYGNPVHAGEETFDIVLGAGALGQRSVDLSLVSTPAIEFRRGYSSGYGTPEQFGMGWGVNHNYNAYLTSDGITKLTYIEINGENKKESRLYRQDPGRGFNAHAIYKSEDDETYGAQLKWEAGKYYLRYRDGSMSTFLQCDNPPARCYWTGYQDAKGDALSFDRDLPYHQLGRLSSQDSQGITFQYDDHQQMTEAAATDGKAVSYAYDDAGCLARVTRADGQVTLYAYDAGHRMTSAAVIRKRGAQPEEILSAEYDRQGRVVKLALANIGAYQIEYLATNGIYATELRVTEPSGQKLNISMDNENYVVRGQSVQFPRVVAHR